MVNVFSYTSGEGEHLTVNGIKLAVTSILKDFDLALIELPLDCAFEITELGSAAELEQAELINDVRVVR
ncbi:hypothetical protein [Methanosarcina mazei]|uniref:hypothetical protein n=1 Tax=Methanosarcina mazei TaxID=2209 RepID=UPI000ADC3D74|nr:hypothetical protein [Methanosarcina mazei]